MARRIFSFFLLGCMISGVFGQGVVFNEIMSSNSGSLFDEDFDTPDWVEFYNASNNTINLEGYGLSDNINNPFKWTFPSVEMEPGEFLVVFASEKDRVSWPAHFETVVDWGDSFAYVLGNPDIPQDWASPDFDDSLMPQGPSGLGHGDDDDATIVPRNISLYIRNTFTFESIESVSTAHLSVDYDDAFVAYLNGVEIARSNIGIPGIIPAWDDRSITRREARLYRGLPMDQFHLEDPQSLLTDGDNVLAIQVHNKHDNDGDMTIIPFLTFGMTAPPPNPRGLSNTLNTYELLNLHTNFKISSTGETLLLTDPDWNTVDGITVNEMPSDFSYGRQPDGGDDWFYFDEATPRSENSTESYTDFADPPEFSMAGGFYPEGTVVSLSASPQATIRYTLDGADPTPLSEEYTDPLQVSETTVIRARAYESGLLQSPYVANSYIVRDDFIMPVVSISTDPDHLWDEDTGLYTNPFNGLEYPANIEFFEQDGDLGFNLGFGVRLHGGSGSLPMDQKSFVIQFRSEYGVSSLENYQLFPDKPIDSFKSFILRNSGNDFLWTMIRDSFMTGLVKHTDVDIQAYRPATVYVNGEYWGIMNMREKVNEHFLESNRGVDPDNIDMLNNETKVLHGDRAHYQAMLDFIDANDLSIPENYEYIKTQMDVHNFMMYNVAEFYFVNRDWPGNNLKYWRPREEGGRWKWILFDTDFGFNMLDANTYNHNMFTFALRPDGPNWPNPPWSTFLLRMLNENDEFQIDFINCFADMLNTSFKSEYVLQKLDEAVARIDPEIYAHRERWNQSIEVWEHHIDLMREFATLRSSFLAVDVMQQYDISGVAPLEVNVLTEGGDVKVNSVIPEEYPWNPDYFIDVPITLTALPETGYVFVEWQGDVTSTDPQIEVTLTGPTSISAVFELDEAGDIMISEINYRSAGDFDPDDWVEFYNHGDEAMDLTGWEFKDEDDLHVFPFPDGTIIQPEQAIVVCTDTVLFRSLFPGNISILGNLEFGFSGNGELLRLFDAEGELADFVEYDDTDPWPTEPDGNGPTLELTDPDLDNALPESWQASANHGSPADTPWIMTVDPINAGLSQIPDRYSIDSVYPNPFNSTLTVSIALPRPSVTQVYVYNVLGQNVATLFDGDLSAGRHRFTFEATGMASGLYFVRATVPGHLNQVQKVMLVR
ncbi:MAG TPA: T9SS type A sorting domain-containing protein [Bacteroidetes bacterium]|nr:cotH protein [bacterium BMS3Bbin04]HDO64784.1 T9SS type A sorting domain-containing protein [Bacteroidota bacterium]HEX03909.1 T9SS type A sorting domain-containing protein [Bacteroidota bacterium]